MKRYQTAIAWFRRDLRNADHAALYHALREACQVHCVFVFDSGILDSLHNREDRRVEFIWYAVRELALALEQWGGTLRVLAGPATELVPALARKLKADAVYANHDYEPQAVERDAAVARSLQEHGARLHTFKDHVIFERDEILTQANTPFTVFTPYKRAWLARLDPFYCKAYPLEKYRDALARGEPAPIPPLESVGFKPTNLKRMKLPTGMSGAHRMFQDFLGRIDGYHERRDYPAVRGVSYLSVHLRFGTISIRELVRAAASIQGPGAQTWLSELVWRDFYFAILHHFPYVTEHAFKRGYDALRFPNSKVHFTAWCEGRTGYPLVDAAMRQLNQTGYMHNRLRMVAASFLVKDLHVDWRWGERYFAERLNDFDLAANNGGWQWSASTGCDAQPWFRVFNPVTQSRNFDPDGRFIRMYVPELEKVDSRSIHEPWTLTAMEQQAAGITIGKEYPLPIVDHAAARKRTLEIYKAAGEP
ncbi:MAG TPA: deoxyribodipyrimidine photo-lyase [Burkholderiales bacterium]